MARGFLKLSVLVGLGFGQGFGGLRRYDGILANPAMAFLLAFVVSANALIAFK